MFGVAPDLTDGLERRGSAYRRRERGDWLWLTSAASAPNRECCDDPWSSCPVANSHALASLARARACSSSLRLRPPPLLFHGRRAAWRLPGPSPLHQPPCARGRGGVRARRRHAQARARVTAARGYFRLRTPAASRIGRPVARGHPDAAQVCGPLSTGGSHRDARHGGLSGCVSRHVHLTEFRFRMPGTRLDGTQLGTSLATDLSATWLGVPWRGAAYLVGTACVTFHFAAGLWGLFLAASRGSEGARRRKWAAWVAVAVGSAVWVAFASIVVFHATGAKLFGEPALESGNPN